MLQREWNRIDWSLLSQNKYIYWTAEMINLCKDQLDWHLFSKYAQLQREEEERETKAMIGRELNYWEVAERMADKLDWSMLSIRMEVELSYEFLDKLTHRVDWLHIINRCG